MSASPYIITGVKAGCSPGGAVPVRQEIDDWSSKAENQKQVNLFLLALRRFQDVPPSERDSFFQVAGIHGMPYKLWDEDQSSYRTPQDDGRGYCTHANYLFPPWHRPYLLLFEQQLHEIMVKDIVPQFSSSERQAWQEAADTWRLPFWDWAANPKVPNLATSNEVTVTAPPGVTVRMDNPLYKFQMPNDKTMGSEGVGTIKGDEGVELAYGNCYATSRCPTKDQVRPTSKDWVEGVVNNGKVEEFMCDHISVNDKQYGAAAEMVYRLLMYPLSYEHFSTVAITNADEARVDTDINLEFIHNNIHYWAGGDGGHMSQIPVATFDPIFWLHHCNIDRIFAIWQQLNPDKWFTEGAQAKFDQHIIGIDPEQIVTNKTPLRPFHKDKNGNWTPDDVRNHLALGYTYPEIKPWNPENQTGGQFDRAKSNSRIRTIINAKYGQCRQESLDILDEAQQARGDAFSPATAIAIATADGSPATAIARAHTKPMSSERGVGPVPGGMKITADGRAIETNDFAISVRYYRFAFGGHPFNIEICLAPADSAQSRDSARDYVANVYNFSSPAKIDGEEVCSNCTTLQGQNVKVSSYVPVNVLLNKLLKEQSVSSLDKETVTDALQRLYWRVIKYGKEVPVDQLQGLGLQIIVSMSSATHHKDPSQPSVFENFEVIPSLGFGLQGVSFLSTSSGGDSQDATRMPSDIQYLALDKTVKLKKQVPLGGAVTVGSAYINLNAPPNVKEDSTGLSFMHLDESIPQDIHDEENYDVLLSFSIRRKDKVVRLNNKPAHSSWKNEDNFKLDKAWFKTPNPKIKIEDAGDLYKVYIDNAYILHRNKNDPHSLKNITHVQYWYKDIDQKQSALSYALDVSVSEPGQEHALP